MNKIKIVLNKGNIGSLLKSESTQTMLKSHADKAVNSLGEGHSSDVFLGKNRANASISADSIEAKRKNLKENTLLKAVLR